MVYCTCLNVSLDDRSRTSFWVREARISYMTSNCDRKFGNPNCFHFVELRACLNLFIFLGVGIIPESD